MLDLSALDDAALFASGARSEVAPTAPLSAFEPDPGNPRFEPDPASFAELVEDVRRRGILQPIVARRTPEGKLLIRFGERRYRAAVELALEQVPYVLTEDPRQFDDYAQVAENAKRRDLQPLELASFIERKLGQGETRRAVALNLRLDPSAVTHLLALTGNPPALIVELYQSRRCRSPQYLYELRKLYEAAPALVAQCLGSAQAVDRQLIDTVAEQVRRAAAVAAVEQRGAVGSARLDGAADAVADALDRQIPRNVPTARHGRQRGGGALPVLEGSCHGRALRVLLDRPPSRDGMLGVRFDDAEADEEVAIGEVILTRLVTAPSG